MLFEIDHSVIPTLIHRKELRKKLQCKSFKWYLDTVFPELFIPGESVASGEIKNPFTNLCLGTAESVDNIY